MGRVPGKTPPTPSTIPHRPHLLLPCGLRFRGKAKCRVNPPRRPTILGGGRRARKDNAACVPSVFLKTIARAPLPVKAGFNRRKSPSQQGVSADSRRGGGEWGAQPSPCTDSGGRDRRPSVAGGGVLARTDGMLTG